MPDYPISHEVGKQVNRFDIDEYVWPTVTTEMKDGSRRVRHLTNRPTRRISFEYDAIQDKTFASTLITHYFQHGHAHSFNLRIPPRPSTPYSAQERALYFSTLLVRYVSFRPRRMQNVDPFRWPSFRVEFEEVF